MRRTVTVRVGTVAQARRELKEDVTAITRGERVRHRREIWFATLEQAAAALTERRLDLLRLIHRTHPRSTQELAHSAHRGTRAVDADLRALAAVGLVHMADEDGTHRPVAACDRIQVAGDIAVTRVAA